MNINEAADKLTIVTVEGKNYLGVLECTANATVVKYAMLMGDKGNIRRWFAGFNVDDLATINITPNLGFITRPLAREQLLEVDRAKVNMAYAKKFAIAALENEMFNKKND